MRRAVLHLLRLALLCVAARVTRAVDRIQFQHLLPSDSDGATPVSTFGEVEGQAIAPLCDTTDLPLDYWPQNGSASHTALAVFMQSAPDANIRYTIDGSQPTTASAILSFDKPFLHLNTTTTLRAIAVAERDGARKRACSEQLTLIYHPQGGARPDSHAFLIPDRHGIFVSASIEFGTITRRLLSYAQEFADFGSISGVAPYAGQLRYLALRDIDPELGGFEGGFQAKDSQDHYYGYLIPFHNGDKYFGKLVRINLRWMASGSGCESSIRRDYVEDGEIVREGDDHACVTIIDLAGLNPRLVGFRRGFTGTDNTPRYGYLTPAADSVAVRVDLEDFGLHSVETYDLRRASSQLAGYSSGFEHNGWACLVPFMTFIGPVGGVQSSAPADKGQTEPLYHGMLACINGSAWKLAGQLETNSTRGSFAEGEVIAVDLTKKDVQLRGFSSAIKVGPHVFLVPMMNHRKKYVGKVARLRLSLHGPPDVRSETIDVLDLTSRSEELVGFISGFNVGQYIFLVPFRNTDARFRGHGNVVRININAAFSSQATSSAEGVTSFNLANTTRNQIPGSPDADLTGFSGGFASGKYALFVPYFNGLESTKIARVHMSDDGDLQELDISESTVVPREAKAFRGGFVSTW